ncbi:MAG: argininosuccinate synthase [Thermomicrobiales bacterium]
MANLETALRKVQTTAVPQVHKLALAYAGGLDSTLCALLAKEKYGATEVVALLVDIGQSQEEIRAALARAEQLGLTPLVLDVKSEFSEIWLKKAIRANVDYNGYPCSTSMARQLIAAVVAQRAVELGCDALMEGSTGKGNDQFRMHNVFSLFAPGLAILVPVRDFDLTRPEEAALCEHYGVPVNESLIGGNDTTLWCRSLVSGGLDLDTVLPDDLWLWYVPPQQAPDEPTTLTLRFEEGVPIAVDGRRLAIRELVPLLNELGGRNGIGKLDIWEDGILDFKSRELYEAPAATIILKLHHDLEALCLTKDELAFKKTVDQRWSTLVYNGEWFHPLRADLDAFIAQTQGVVNGEYTVALYKGNIDIVSRQSNSGLFAPEVRSITAESFNQQLSASAARLRGLTYEVLAKRAARMHWSTVGAQRPAGK